MCPMQQISPNKRVYSTAQSLLSLLSDEIKSNFRVNVYAKYALKHDIISYLFDQIPRGLNFSQLKLHINHSLPMMYSDDNLSLS